MAISTPPTIEKLGNGLTVIIDEAPDVLSVSYQLSIPGGLVSDPQGKVGRALIFPEFLMRGAGDLSAVDLSNAFDDQGIVHSESAGSDRFFFRGSLLPEQLEKAFSLLSLILNEPTFPAAELPPIQSLLLMDIESLKDNPSSQAMSEMHERYFPNPYNRRSVGYAEDIVSVTADECRRGWQELWKPDGAILSVCGNIKKADILKLAEKFFGNAKGKGFSLPELKTFPPFAKHHIQKESAQLQIVLAYPSPLYSDPAHYAAKVASSIMSNSMYGRLFLEVREKRGLCYSVYSRYACAKQYAVVTAYAGTTPERAHETLEVMLQVLKSGKGTVGDDELRRAKVGIKSAIALGEESTSARCSSNASDVWLGGEVRGIDEISKRIDAISKADLDDYFTKYSPESFMLLTLGGRSL
jgi:predicted Zn-dependent peptidase